MDSPIRNTAAENDGIVSTLAFKDEPHSPQYTEDMERQPTIASQEPRTTAAAEATLALAGIGSAYTTYNHEQFPRGNLDDEFTTTTDMTQNNDRIVPDTSISCDLAGG
jgi:hypothetical protein